MSVTFNTKGGKAASINIPTWTDLSEYALSVEYDDNAKFRHPRVIGEVSYQNRTLNYYLSTTDVMIAKNGHFRIKATKDGELPFYATYGTIRYTPLGPSDQIDILDDDGRVSEGLMPDRLTEETLDLTYVRVNELDIQVASLVNGNGALEEALRERYINRDEYVPGETGTGVGSVNDKVGQVILTASDIGAATPAEVQSAVSTAYDDLPSLKLLFENGLI